MALGYQGADGQLPKPPYGPKAKDQYQPHDYNVSLWVTASPTKSVQLPFAYLVDSAWALSRLKMQGVKIEQLRSDIESANCQSMVVSKLKEGQELQNHKLRSIEVDTSSERVSLLSGAYIVRTAQPLGRLAAYLLEPASEDGLFAWNFFDPDVQPGNRVPVTRILSEIPANALEEVRALEPREGLTLAHIFKPGSVVEYSTTSNNGATWLEGTNDLVLKRDKRWLTVDPKTGASQPNELLKKMIDAFAALPAFEKDKSPLERVGPANLSGGLKYGLLSHEQDLYLFKADSGSAGRLTFTPKAEEQLAELSPTGSHVAFVRDNNLFVVDCQTGDEKQLTKDGSSELLNGILDWVYQEEVYGRGNFRAFWFSPNGQQLAFLQLDQTPVQRYAVSDSIHYRQELEETRYPKAGDPCPSRACGLRTSPKVSCAKLVCRSFRLRIAWWCALPGHRPVSSGCKFRIAFRMSNRSCKWTQVQALPNASCMSRVQVGSRSWANPSSCPMATFCGSAICPADGDISSVLK